MVQQPGTHPVSAGGRIGEAIISAKPSVDAYVLGAALLRDQERERQLRLKAGLAYDLQQLGQARDPAIAATARRLGAWLTAQPVTGRVPAQQLEPRLLRLRPEINPPAQPGDVVFYPGRPQTVSVMGAVVQDCALPADASRSAANYLAECPVNRGADRDTLYVIQPDGTVQTIGIALWNRDEPQAVAPGAILYVPLAQRQARRVDPAFNSQFAQFLATQVLNPQVAK